MENKMKLILIAILLGIIGGLWNRIRGGWSKHMNNRFMASLTHGTRRIFMALITTISLYLPVYLIAGFNPVSSFVDLSWFIGVWLVALIVGLLPGWGSWFLIGRHPNSYKHNQDALLGEVIAFLFYGHKWVPTYHNLSDKSYKKLVSRFNIIPSPNGSIRPVEWRKKYERLAMMIRGLYITIPSPTIFAFHMFREYGYELCWIALVFPMGLLMGLCYECGWWFYRDKLPKFMQGTTEIGEILAGATIMSSLLFAGSTIALYLL
jgi:hypothetical protein